MPDPMRQRFSLKNFSLPSASGTVRKSVPSGQADFRGCSRHRRNRFHPQKPFFNGPGEGFRTGRTGALRVNKYLGQTGGQAGASDKRYLGQTDGSDKQTVRINRRPGRMPEQKCSQSASAATTAPQHRNRTDTKRAPLRKRSPSSAKPRRACVFVSSQE